MDSLGIKSVMLDTSYCIRLMDNTDPLHQHALDYFKYFLNEKISMHVSTIAVAEYAVGDDPRNLPLDKIRLESFDFRDAETAGLFHKTVKGNQSNIANYNRRIITNDVKIIAQVRTKSIDAIISKDIASLKSFIQPLSGAGLLNVQFLDLNVPLNAVLGQLFIP
jgi:predicted nucleic acid-binding protein